MKYYLYHYYERENGPFKNLSSLSLEAGEEVLRKLKQEPDVFASNRSDDYLKIRRELEKTARELFIAKGGKPKKEYPHYMTLGKCEWIQGWYKDGGELFVDLEEFSPEILSFTYGDLFPTMRYKDGKEYRGQVYTKTEIMDLINRYGLPQQWNPEGKKGPERYVEVQIWDDKALRGKFNEDSSY